jgi:hypothetical protein
MRRKIWMHDPHAGGTTIPSGMREATQRRIRAYADRRYAGTFSRLDIRFHGALCYVDAYVEPEPPSRRLLHVLHETREEYFNRVREIPLHLCRLRYFGGQKIWSMAFYTYSNERYEPCTFPNGAFYGTPEEGFEVGAAYLRARSGVPGPRPRKKRAAEHHASAVRQARVTRLPADERARSAEKRR